MKCPTCRSDVAEGSRFCSSCGSAVPAPPGAAPSRSAGDDATIAVPHSSSPAGPPTSSPSPSSGPGVRFPPGTLIGERYRIVGLLGSGGMGEVYRADDLTLGQSVALKFLPEALADDPDRRNRLLTEVRTARVIAHPNVCRVYDVGEVDGQLFLSMEYVDGDDLSSLLRRIGRVPGEKAVEIGRQLCAGLAALHDRGVLHRDLKPANVLVDGRGRVRITDFGLATAAGAVEGQRVGTPAYMAPEQLEGRAADERSDVYSLGLVLYELFTGRRAFEADTIAELVRLQREATPTSPSVIITDLDPAVERVLARCLEKDPARRPPSAIAVAAALPGGDPLAAALAAGEIPSMEMVAAAGEKGGVRPLVGIACVAAVVVAIVLFATVNARDSLYRYDPMAKPPSVLADRAREILRGMGYEDPPEDTAWGFERDAAILGHIRDESSALDRWDDLTDARPAAVQFWYRESPGQLVVDNMRGVVTETDPPNVEAGMASVRLDTTGRLLRLQAVPPQKDPPPGTEEGSAFDWAKLFAAAELDPAAFEDVTPEWVPRDFADRRAAWTGKLPGSEGTEIRVEAAAFRDRPVELRIVGPWTRDPTGEQEAMTTSERIFVIFFLVLLLVVLAVAVFLAVRNVRLGRGDQKGARRIGLFLFLALMVNWAGVADHAAELDDEINLFFQGVASALFVAGLVWTLYLALEPYARRAWPDQMVAWSRILTGRWRDPLVGRDVLVGGVFLLFRVAVGALRQAALQAGGRPPVAPDSIQWQTLLGPAPAGAWVIACLVNALVYALFTLLLLMILRITFRSQMAAIVAFALIVTAFVFFTGGRDVRLLNAVQGVLIGAAWAFVLFRFGLVAFVTGMFFQLLVDFFPVTLDGSVWWSGASWLAIGVILAVTGFGLHTALAGKPLFGDELGETPSTRRA